MTTRATRWAVVALLLLLGCAHRAPAPASAPPDPLNNISAKALYDQGLSLARAGDYVRAEQYLAAALDRGHAESQVIRELIGVCIRGARYRASLRYALPYLRRHPQDWSLRYLVATLFLATDEVASARRELEQIVASHPEKPRAHYLLAVLLAERFREPAAARLAFERYLTLAPSGPHAAEASVWLRRTGEGNP